MLRTLAIAALLLSCACSGRANNFGDPRDTGNTGDMGEADIQDAGRTPADVGSPCEGPTDCVEGSLCIGTSAGAFECMSTCDTAYEFCGAGAVCLPVTTQDAAICYAGGTAAATEACASNLDCAPGLLCFGAGTEFYCRGACAAGRPCAAGQFCLALDSGAGLCRPVVGAACSDDLDCPEARSCSEADPNVAALFPGGYCTASCARDLDCGAGAVCRPVAGTARSMCLAQCTHVSDCRFNGGYDCLDQAACVGSSDPTACRVLFGEDSLCVPGPF